VLQNVPASKAAQMLGMNAPQIYLAKHRVGLQVKRAAREIEAAMNQLVSV
jgi:hypothetical protein